MALALEHRWIDDVAVVACSGRLVEGGEAATLRKHVNDLAAENPHIVLNLGGVDFVDSSGIGLLVRLLTQLRNSGGSLAICAASPKIREVLTVTRLHRILTPHESEVDAIADVFRSRAAVPGPLAGGAILCVEPSPDVLAYVREMLRSAGFAVVSAANISDALTLLTATRPRVIVMNSISCGASAAAAFKQRAGALPIIELPPQFSSADAGTAGALLLGQVHAVLGAAPTTSASPPRERS